MTRRGGFRGSDETLAREIETLQAIGAVRLRQAARALAEVDRDLRELRREKRRRRAEVPALESGTGEAHEESAA